jgi:arylsulfatase A-like enzyme
MIMSHDAGPRWRRLLEPLTAVVLGLAFLGIEAAYQLQAMDRLSDNWSNLVEVLRLRLDGTPLGEAVYMFIAMQLLLHAGFGLLCWLLALATGNAFPQWAHRRFTLLFGWFAVAVLWVLVGNATEYPWSNSGTPSKLIAYPVLERFRLFDLLTLLVVLTVSVVLLRIALAMPRLRRQLPRISLFSVLGLVAWATVHVSRLDRQGEDTAASAKPNLILIGIDSLRCDAVGAGRGLGLTPNIDRFLRDGAHRFTDAITPLGRTFPSWTSILSGRYPVATGARENLIALDSLPQFDTVAEIAQAAGYHTVYATDEVRFSNIDRSFGFDQVITPAMGAADFLLGKANDLPLPNMISNTWLGRNMFPATYGNRAAALTYRPETFVDWIDSEFTPRDQNLFAVHLALPHNPYTWAKSENETFARSTDRAYLYANAVIEADKQFGAIMEMLERKGMLKNALVVLLSDHGEALGIPTSDTLLRGETARQLLDGENISLWGHGTSVLSPHQYATVLAIRGYGAAELSPSEREHPEPVSMVDIAPTLVDLANLKANAPFDGSSLGPLIAQDPAAKAAFLARPRFTETGFRTRLIMLGDFDESRVMGEAAAFFVMDPDTGRFEVRPELVEKLIADKERAALSQNWLLAAIPVGEGRKLQKYVLVSRRGGLPRRLESPPAQDADPEIRGLWQALNERYGAEMLPPAPYVELPPIGLAAAK